VADPSAQAPEWDGAHTQLCSGANPGRVDYVHFNPVKHGYVTFARDWPYSTFNRLVKAGLYPADWGAGDVEDFPAGEAQGGTP
jgi:hypothetical protein